MERVFDFLINEIKLKSDDIVIAGVSAGPDSMALLHVLLLLREKYDFKVIVAHINHNVRKESYEEALFLEEYCQQHDVIFEKMIIEKYGDDNFQNEARNIRYAFFRDLIVKYHANYLMTGHHGDDLMETILMRIVRGASLHGYSGFNKIIDKKDYKIVRPLIFVSKDELEKYDIKEKIPYRIDKSNFQDKYTRNRYRKEVLSFLKKEDPFVHEKFLKFSIMLQEYDQFVNETILKSSNGSFNGMIDINQIKNNNPFIIRRTIEKILNDTYRDDLFEVDDRHIELVYKTIFSKRAHLSLDFPNDYVLVKEYNKLSFKKKSDNIPLYDIELNDKVFLPNGMTIEKVDSCDSDGNDVLRLNKNDVLLPLRVRNRKRGDRMTIKNMQGTKKVSDILINSKVPYTKRDSWPIVVDSNDRIVWIPLIKKSKYNRLKIDSCDIIFKCLDGGEKNE